MAKCYKNVTMKHKTKCDYYVTIKYKIRMLSEAQSRFSGITKMLQYNINKNA